MNVKKVTCPGCAQSTEVNSIQLNAGQWCQCQECKREFRLAKDTAPSDLKFEIKPEGNPA